MALESQDDRTALIQVVFSYTMELINAANMVASPDPELRSLAADWLPVQQAALGDRGREFLDFSQGMAWPTMSVCDYVTSTQEWHSWDRLAAYMRSQPILDFLYVVFNSDLSRETIKQAIATPSLIALHTRELSVFSSMETTTLLRIFADPERFRSLMVDFIGDNRTPAFAERLDSLKNQYESAIRKVEVRLENQHPIEVVEDLRRKKFQGARDFEIYTFTPSFFIGKRSLMSYLEGRFSLSYNAQLADAQWAVDSTQLANQLKVLADPSRLEIIRILSRGPSYATELAGRLGVTTATASRHLDQLRTAGIVREERADTNNIKLMHLNRRAIDALIFQIHRVSGSNPDGVWSV